MDVLQEVVGPLAEVRSCRLAASHHGVDDCSILGCVVVLAEQVVLPAYGYRMDVVSPILKLIWNYQNKFVFLRHQNVNTTKIWKTAHQYGMN